MNSMSDKLVVVVEDERAMLEFMQRLGRLRAGEPLLRTGSWPPALVAEPELLAYARLGGGRAAVIVLNRSAATRQVSIDAAQLGMPDGTTFVDGLDPNSAAIQVSAARLDIEVPPRSAQIWLTP